MTITVTLPDDIARHPDPGREALEAFVIEGYHSRALTSYQTRQLSVMVSYVPAWRAAASDPLHVLRYE